MRGDKYAASRFAGRLCALACIGMLLNLGGCAELGRIAAVSAKDTGRASVLGISNARYYANDNEHLVAEFRRLQERETKYFNSIGRPLPPEDVLAISGGGDNGAFGAGLLIGLTESGKRPSFRFVTGISTGALIAPFAFLGLEFDPVLAEMYTSIDQSNIFEKRPIVTALVSDAMADTEPLKNLIARYLDEQILERIAGEYRRGRTLIIITTNLDAGLPVIWNIGAIADSGHPQAVTLIRQILLASASVPAVFPPVMFTVTVDGVDHQELHVDGGATMQTFLYPPTLPVGKLSAVGPRRKRTAYIVRNGRLAEDWSETERSTLSIATRAVATLTTNSGVGDLYRIYASVKRDGIGFRLAVIDDDFVEPHPREFDHAYMVKLFEYARAKARGGYPWRNAPPGF